MTKQIKVAPKPPAPVPDKDRFNADFERIFKVAE